MTPPSELPHVCSWCNRVRDRRGRWREVEPAPERSSEASHGLCPECYGAEMQLLLQEASGRASEGGLEHGGMATH